MIRRRFAEALPAGPRARRPRPPSLGVANPFVTTRRERGRRDVVESEALVQALVSLGCPAAKSGEMAAQLDKRAGQLMTERGWTREHALIHLLGLMRQGWAAQGQGQAPAPAQTPAPDPPHPSPS